MKFLLDTNVISEWAKNKPHGALLAWFASRSLSNLCIPSIVFYEIQAGIERTRLQHPERAAELDRWTDELIRMVPRIPLDHLAARETARLIRGKSLDHLEDAMIDAIAKVNGLTIATRNTKDFEPLGVACFNPFLFRGS